ncbi:MAG: hypothetical protein [Sclerotinia sclerotiorum narnavirus 3]|nr:MAG: hypothetical protein [Sclerotinia sclerotiorum narnavirus 3]
METLCKTKNLMLLFKQLESGMTPKTIETSFGGENCHRSVATLWGKEPRDFELRSFLNRALRSPGPDVIVQIRQGTPAEFTLNDRATVPASLWNATNANLIKEKRKCVAKEFLFSCHCMPSIGLTASSQPNDEELLSSLVSTLFWEEDYHKEIKRSEAFKGMGYPTGSVDLVSPILDSPINYLWLSNYLPNGKAKGKIRDLPLKATSGNRCVLPLLFHLLSLWRETADEVVQSNDVDLTPGFSSIMLEQIDEKAGWSICSTVASQVRDDLSAVALTHPTCGAPDCRLTFPRESLKAIQAKEKWGRLVGSNQEELYEINCALKVLMNWHSLLTGAPAPTSDLHPSGLLPENVPTPLIKEGSTAMKLTWKSSLTWDTGLNATFASFHEGTKGSMIWTSPPNSIKDNVPLPMDPASVKQVRLWRVRKTKVVPKQEIAWAYLISSWNQVNSGKKIPLEKGLLPEYKTRSERMTARGGKTELALAELKNAVSKLSSSSSSLKELQEKCKLLEEEVNHLRSEASGSEHVSYSSEMEGVPDYEVFESSQGMGPLKDLLASEYALTHGYFISRTALGEIVLQPKLSGFKDEEVPKAKSDDITSVPEPPLLVPCAMCHAEVKPVNLESHVQRAHPKVEEKQDAAQKESPPKPKKGSTSKGKGKEKSSAKQPPLPDFTMWSQLPSSWNEVPELGKGEGYLYNPQAGTNVSVSHKDGGCKGQLGFPCAASVTCPCPHCLPVGVAPSPAVPAIGKSNDQKKEDPLLSKDPLKTGIDVSAKKEIIPAEVLESLKRFFKIPAPLEKETWDALSTEERRRELKARRVPAWALKSYRRDPSNLSRILSGTITARDTADKKSRDPGNSPELRAKAEAQWVALKSKFPGVVLLSRPQSGKEKALKKAFDSLVKEYGTNVPNLPKPRAGKSSSKSSPTRGRSRSAKEGRPESDNGLLQITELLKLVSSCNRAFRGDL